MSESGLEDRQAVLCDMCFGDVRKPARKTCTKCEISMCVEHLQAHLTTPVLLQTHPLTEPMAAGATTKCPQHGKVLEYYCLDDMSCVCVSCAIEGQHRLHDMKTFPTAHKELTEQLRADLQGLKAKSSGDESLETWEKSEREKVCRSSARLIEAVTQLRDVSLASVQSSVSARMAALRRGVSSVEAALREKDALGFLQVCAQARRDVQQAQAVDLRAGLEPGSPRDQLVEELQQKGEKMSHHVGQFLCDLLTLVDPEHQSEPGGPPSNYTFDAKTLRPGMSLSEDKKKVFYSSWRGELSAHLLGIQRPKEVSNFKTWVIALPEKWDWTVGLCDTSYTKNMKEGTVYALRWQDEELASLSGKAVAAPVQMASKKRTRPRKVEVVHDVKKRSLSFSSVTGEYQRVKLVSVQISGDDVELCPFVRLGKAPPQSNADSKGGFSPETAAQSGAGVFGVGQSFSGAHSGGGLSFGGSQSGGGLSFGGSQSGGGLSFGGSQSGGGLSFGGSQSDGGGLSFGGSQSGGGLGSFGSLFGSAARTQINVESQNMWNCQCGLSYVESTDGYDINGRFYHKSSRPLCSCGAVIGSPQFTEVLCELL